MTEDPIKKKKKKTSTATGSGYYWIYWSPIEANRAACIFGCCIELWSVKYHASSMGININGPPSHTFCTCSAKTNVLFLKVPSLPTLKSTFTSGLVSSCLEILSSLEPARVARGHLQAARWQNLIPGHCRWEKFDGAFPGDPQRIHRETRVKHTAWLKCSIHKYSLSLLLAVWQPGHCWLPWLNAV